MDSNCSTVFYSYAYRADKQCGKSGAKFPLIHRSFLNEINVLIYQGIFVLEFLACAVVFGTQKLILSTQTSLKRFFGLKFGTYSRSSRKRPPREFRKVVATRAGRLREWALVSDHVMKQ